MFNIWKNKDKDGNKTTRKIFSTKI